MQHAIAHRGTESASEQEARQTRRDRGEPRSTFRAIERAFGICAAFARGTRNALRAICARRCGDRVVKTQALYRLRRRRF